MGVIDNEKATARAHIMFDLDDKPNQLVKALEALKDAVSLYMYCIIPYDHNTKTYNIIIYDAAFHR